MLKNRNFYSDKLWFFVAVAIAGLIAGAVLITSFGNVSQHSLLCSLAGSYKRIGDSTQNQQLQTILHYATSRVVPQQSISEIRVSFDVLQSLSPCNFLIFGLGHDSLMWSSFNPRGTTLFLEEDSKWIQSVLKDASHLNAHHVVYPTHLSQADELIKSYRSEPDCLPSNTKSPITNVHTQCKLALTSLPKEVYDKEWDLIMIDAPKGYYPEAPGRMGAIYSAVVMARARMRPGVTHVFLHDVDRRVEKMFAEEFLCKKYLVKAVGRLWHFEIPSAVNDTGNGGATTTGSFC
ncbi:Glucuronoxylan 4-o-methyltransferase [Thalictrum thalictroides]|uniref:Glucuronoxylan 4-o-methyltransferase n=1 Tax=Thalictrum thalictroides TaxID=46969 RepID=A0A7J6WY32_THATH|nr:Glucuronoxylan 4-o-methyltransferase [Thalictrum thalictroides]